MFWQSDKHATKLNILEFGNKELINILKIEKQKRYRSKRLNL